MSHAPALPLEPKHHAHDLCVRGAMDRAEALCAARGAKLTDQRRKILELVWTGHKPIGAYEILDLMAKDGHKAAPPTVYRALDFLLDQGLVHRIEMLNAFIGCPGPLEDHASVFLICRQCREVTEAAAGQADAVLKDLAHASGFSAERRVVEIAGLCRTCAAA